MSHLNTMLIMYLKNVLQYQEKITQLNFIFVLVYTSGKWHISFLYFIENKQTFKLIF